MKLILLGLLIVIIAFVLILSIMFGVESGIILAKLYIEGEKWRKK